MAGTGGQILGGSSAAGAFAAFMSTSSGLLVSIAGTISYDVWPRRGRRAASAAAPQATSASRRRSGIGVPALLALARTNLDISLIVGWAFALAASTFCPLFLLGIWWTRLTSEGAAAGIIIGGLLATSVRSSLTSPTWAGRARPASCSPSPPS